jgi:DinB family protein
VVGLDSTPPESVVELIERVRVAWETLESTLARASGSQLEVPHRGGWTIKDQLAHIAEWERASTFVVRHRPQWEAFDVDEATYYALGSVDALNEVLFQRNRSLDYGEVLARGRQAHAALLDALEDLRDNDLQTPMSSFSGFREDDSRTLLDKIAGDTYLHYAEHTAWISEQL